MSPTDRMFCRKCGYALVANASNTCPECGRQFDRADPGTYARWRWARVVTHRRLVVLATLLATYVGSYAVWSRWAMRQAVEWDAGGYYFFPPENSARWETLNFTVASTLP